MSYELNDPGKAWITTAREGDLHREDLYLRVLCMESSIIKIEDNKLIGGRKMRAYKVYYQKVSDRLDFFSDREIVLDDLFETHAMVASVQANDHDELFAIMNGAKEEHPNPLATGSGQELLKSKNVSHTSMSVNDVMSFDYKYFRCASSGWEEIKFSTKYKLNSTKIIIAEMKEEIELLNNKNDYLRKIIDEHRNDIFKLM